MQIPEQYTTAIRELDRLFRSGELNVANYTIHSAIAFAAIKGHPNANELVEGIALFDPNPGDDDTDLVPLGGAESE